MEQGDVTVGTGRLHAKTAVLVKKQVVEKLALLFGKNSSAVPSIKVPDSSVHAVWPHGMYYEILPTLLNGRESLRDTAWAMARFTRKEPRQQSTWRHPHELVLIIYLQELSTITMAKFRGWDSHPLASNGGLWNLNSSIASDIIPNFKWIKNPLDNK